MKNSNENTAKNLSGIDFIDETERQYFAEAQVGQEVLDFLSSPTGRLLHGRAKQEVEQAKRDLLEIDPTTRRGFRKFKQIQAKAQNARRFSQWCADAIQTGNAAVTQLEFYRSDV